MTQNVAVLGMGAMGSRVATRIAEAGHHVTVWNRSPAAAEQLAATSDSIAQALSARDAAAGADVVISMVADVDASRSLWLDPETGVLAVAGSAVVVEASTITRAWATSLSEAADTAGVSFLEAPVVGSRPQADAGALFVLAGGDADVVERARPVVEAYAGAIRHVGPAGTAATLKLAINGLFGIQVAAYAEVVGMLSQSGIDPADAIGLLSGLPITSPGLQRILGLFDIGDFRPNFPVELVAKDFRYLTQLADQAAAKVPLIEAAASVFDEGASSPIAGDDITGIAKLYT